MDLKILSIESVDSFSEPLQLPYMNTFKYHVFAPMRHGKISARINLPLFYTVLPSNSRLFLSCRPFVVITTFSTGLMGVEVTSVRTETTYF